MNLLIKAAGAIAAVLVSAFAISTYKSTASFQMGAPGVGMEIVETKASLAAKVKANAIPPVLPPASQDGQLAVDAYQNVQVMGHISSGEFTRLMTAMTLWVAPNDGCGYCHAPQRDANGLIVKNDEGYALADPNNMQSDELYTKRVARRMLQMVLRINGDWKHHVQDTGVTCYTCHRGNPVPANIWFDQDESGAYRTLGRNAGQNSPSALTGYTSLPNTALRTFLTSDENIRVQSTRAIDRDNRASIKQTEWTYGLMIHISNSLGVNCTYCHNSRSMGEWNTSPETRTTAWYGIRMVRELNTDYLEPLLSSFPAARLGAQGDVPKVNCATCHAGAYKPLLGVSMLKDYQVLSEAKPQPEKTVVPSANDADAGESEIGDAGRGGGASEAGDGAAPLDASRQIEKMAVPSADAAVPLGTTPSMRPSALPSASAPPLPSNHP